MRTAVIGLGNVLMGDDATNSGYFVFVADKAGDLSAGTLYVAKVGAGFSIDPAATTAAPESSMSRTRPSRSSTKSSAITTRSPGPVTCR